MDEFQQTVVFNQQKSWFLRVNLWWEINFKLFY